MTPSTCQQFQELVSQFTLRHKSVLDILSKLDESAARVQRAVIKSVTQCGCTKIETGKKPLAVDLTLEEWKCVAESHLKGDLCEDCREVVEREFGKLFFYVAALCNTLDIEMNSVILREKDKVSTLRFFNLT